MSDGLCCIDCGKRNASLRVLGERWRIDCPDCGEARWIHSDFLTPDIDALRASPDQVEPCPDCYCSPCDCESIRPCVAGLSGATARASLEAVEEPYGWILECLFPDSDDEWCPFVDGYEQSIESAKESLEELVKVHGAENCRITALHRDQLDYKGALERLLNWLVESERTEHLNHTDCGDDCPACGEVNASIREGADATANARDLLGKGGQDG